MKTSDRACRDIRAASTESEVIRAVSEYLAGLDPTGVVALLPAELLTGLKQAEEVIHSSLHAAHGQMARLRESPDADSMSDIVLVLSTAARRLAVLAKNTA